MTLGQLFRMIDQAIPVGLSQRQLKEDICRQLGIHPSQAQAALGQKVLEDQSADEGYRVSALDPPVSDDLPDFTGDEPPIIDRLRRELDEGDRVGEPSASAVREIANTQRDRSRHARRGDGQFGFMLP